MKRKQKRYENELDIQLEINKYKRRAIELLKAAEGLELLAQKDIHDANDPNLPPKSSQYYLEQAHEKRLMAKQHRRTVQTIEDVKIPHLSQALAAFKTDVMPFMDGDRGVVIVRE